MRGFSSTCCATTTWITARSRIHAYRTGWKTCRLGCARDVQLASFLHVRPRAGAPQGRRRARVAVHGVAYEVDPELAGETVVLWWGLFDNELYVEHGDKRSGPYYPIGGPILLHRYRAHKKTRHERRADASRYWLASSNWRALRLLEDRKPQGGRSHRRTNPLSRSPIRSVPGIWLRKRGDCETRHRRLSRHAAGTALRRTD